MNFSACLVVLVFFFASCLVSDTEGIKCYECQLCNDEFDSSGKPAPECSGSCVKYKTSLGVVRTCIQPRQSEACESVTYNGEDIEGCVCNSDYCNAGSVQKYSVGTALMMLTMLYFIKFMY